MHPEYLEKANAQPTIWQAKDLQKPLSRSCTTASKHSKASPIQRLTDASIWNFWSASTLLHPRESSRRSSGFYIDSNMYFHVPMTLHYGAFGLMRWYAPSFQRFRTVSRSPISTPTNYRFIPLLIFLSRALGVPWSNDLVPYPSSASAILRRFHRASTLPTICTFATFLNLAFSALRNHACVPLLSRFKRFLPPAGLNSRTSVFPHTHSFIFLHAWLSVLRHLRVFKRPYPLTSTLPRWCVFGSFRLPARAVPSLHAIVFMRFKASTSLLF